MPQSHIWHAQDAPQLAALATGDIVHVAPQRDGDLDRFLKSLSTAWHAGEIRPTHRSLPKPERHWRTRKDPFEDVWPRVLVWLEVEPDRIGKEFLERLQGEHPGRFPDSQLRSMQRRLKQWRAAAARRLVFVRDDLGDGVAPHQRPGAR